MKCIYIAGSVKQMRKPIFADMLESLTAKQTEPFVIITVDDKKWIGRWTWDWCNQHRVPAELYFDINALKEGMKKYNSKEAIILLNSFSVDQPYLLDAWQLAKSFKSDIKLYHTYVKWFMDEHDPRTTNPLLRMMPMKKSYDDRIMTIKERIIAYEQKYKDVINQLQTITNIHIQAGRMHKYA